MKKAIAVFVVCCFVAAFADNPHITQLIELVDVAISSPADGDVLTFNAATGKWINNPLPVVAVPEGPKIVARFDQDGVTARTTNILLFAPTETAIYRITSQTDSGTNEGMGLPTLHDGNGVGISSGVSPSASLGGIAQSQEMFIVRLNSGQQVLFDTTSIAAGSVGLHFVVEKL